jgi:thiamine pyrophosphate-dependent acetolactate synthase large subunit-like protein
MEHKHCSKLLTDAGLDTCFANPGTSEMQLGREKSNSSSNQGTKEGTEQ